MTQTTEERIDRLEKAVIQLQSSVIDLNNDKFTGRKSCGCSGHWVGSTYYGTICGKHMAALDAQ